MLKRISNKIRRQGFQGFMRSVKSRMWPVRAHSFPEMADLLAHKSGLEIGGPSRVFSGKGLFPVYPVIGNLDNCNFGATTIWEGKLEEGQNYSFNIKKPVGRQYVLEATNLTHIPSESYDFVLSSHALEHTANPVKALKEWIRVLKVAGIMVLVLPHKDGTFDHARPVTNLDHLIADFENDMGEDDLTHMSEILSLHDLTRDPEAGDSESFKRRAERNYENRCFHHHVFDTRLAVELVAHMKLQIMAVEAILPMHILIVAKKLPTNISPENSKYIGRMDYLKNSPFVTDRAIDA